MRTKRRQWARLYQFLFFWSVLAMTPGEALAQGDPSARPANAHAKRYGADWECDRGYEKIGPSCSAIQVPTHAYLNSRGTGLECDRGYHPSRDECVVFDLPANAHITTSGNNWDCDRGYSRSGETCTAGDR